MRGVQPVQGNKVWSLWQLPGGRAKGHKGTKPRDRHQRPRAMQGRTEKMLELARDPALTTVIHFSMGDV